MSGERTVTYTQTVTAKSHSASLGKRMTGKKKKASFCNAVTALTQQSYNKIQYFFLNEIKVKYTKRQIHLHTPGTGRHNHFDVCCPTCLWHLISTQSLEKRVNFVISDHISHNYILVHILLLYSEPVNNEISTWLLKAKFTCLLLHRYS